MGEVRNKIQSQNLKLSSHTISGQVTYIYKILLVHAHFTPFQNAIT